MAYLAVSFGSEPKILGGFKDTDEAYDWLALRVRRELPHFIGDEEAATWESESDSDVVSYFFGDVIDNGTFLITDTIQMP